MGDFNCSNLELTSLIGGHIKVEGDFNCRENRLTALEGVPKIKGSIYSDFRIQNNFIKSGNGDYNNNY